MKPLNKDFWKEDDVILNDEPPQIKAMCGGGGTSCLCVTWLFGCY